MHQLFFQGNAALARGPRKGFGAVVTCLFWRHGGLNSLSDQNIAALQDMRQSHLILGTVSPAGTAGSPVICTEGKPKGSQRGAPPTASTPLHLGSRTGSFCLGAQPTARRFTVRPPVSAIQPHQHGPPVGLTCCLIPHSSRPRPCPRRARRNKSPYPLPIMVTNCLCWLLLAPGELRHLHSWSPPLRTPAGFCMCLQVQLAAVRAPVLLDTLLRCQKLQARKGPE